jgi:6-phosphogluconolactonase
MRAAPAHSVRVFPDRRALDEFMIGEWSVLCRAAVDRKGRFAAALSGGETPVDFYARLSFSGSDLPWNETHIFLADERCVPLDHPDSNYRMIAANLLRRVPIPSKNVHPVAADKGARAAAERYEKDLRRFFGLAGDNAPRFDLIMLGLGADGHTASLFPGDPGAAETHRLTVPVFRPAPDHDRVSLTLPVINEAEAVVFMVIHAAKAAALKAVLEGPAPAMPAAMVDPRSGPALFLVDRDAAALLSPAALGRGGG